MNNLRFFQDKRTFVGIFCAVFAFSGPAVATAYAQCQYSVEVVHGLPDPLTGLHFPLIPLDMNDNAEVVGRMVVITTDFPFYWSPETGFEVIEFPFSANSATAKSIGNDGTIVGDVVIPNTGTRGFVRYPNGEFSLIEPLEGVNHSNANNVNNLQVVTGTTHNPPTETDEAHIWEDGEMTVIGPLQLEDIYGRDLNDNLAVTGYTGCLGCVNNPDASGYIWQNGASILLPLFENEISSLACAISQEQNATGWYHFEIIPNDQSTHAFFWNGRDAIDLETLPGYSRSFGFDVDAVHGVVGEARAEESEVPHAGWLWKGDKLIDLNTVIPDIPGFSHIRDAVAINNFGQIAADAQTDEGTGFVVLTPITPPGDLNSDCIVDGADLSLLLSEWGTSNSPADLNNDNDVDGVDLGLLLGNWG